MHHITDRGDFTHLVCKALLNLHGSSKSSGQTEREQEHEGCFIQEIDKLTGDLFQTYNKMDMVLNKKWMFYLKQTRDYEGSCPGD